MKTETNNLRAELTGNYCFVRSLEERGGAIDAMIPEKKHSKVLKVLESVEGKTFGQVWQELIQIKGVKFAFQSN